MPLVLGCFALGVLVRRLTPRALTLSPVLDRAVIWVLLPSLVLAKLPEIPFEARAAIPVAVAWGGVAVGAAAVLALSRLFGWDRRVTGTLLLVTPLGNTSFLGLAAVEALLGRDHLPPALAFDQLGSFLALVTYGSFVASRYGRGPGADAGGAGAGASAGASAGDTAPALRDAWRFPPFVALLVGVGLQALSIGLPVAGAFDAIGKLVGPVALTALGLRFTLAIRRRLVVPAAACLAVRMAVIPALALAASTLAGGGLEWSTSVLEAGAPPMVTAGVVAVAVGLDAELAVTVVGFGLLLALGTLPLLAFLV